jgi:hypothetical protein
VASSLRPVSFLGYLDSLIQATVDCNLFPSKLFLSLKEQLQCFNVDAVTYDEPVSS